MTVGEWLKQKDIDTSQAPKELLDAVIGPRIKVGKDEYRPAKFISKLVRYVTLHPSHAEEFVRLALSSGYTFGVAKGEEVYDVYASPYIRSCMTGGEYVDLYARNPKSVGVAYLKRGKGYYARTVIWLDRYHDNIYASDSEARNALLAELKRHGYTPVPKELVVKLQDTEFYPFLDTLFYAYRSVSHPGYLLVSGVKRSSLTYEDSAWGFAGYLRSTQGSLICPSVDDEPATCAVCGADNVVDTDSDGLFYCPTHAANLAWLWEAGRVVRRMRPRDYVLVVDGVYAPPTEAVRLPTGEYVLRQHLGEDYAVAEIGTYAGIALPKDLVTEYEGKKVYVGDLINGQLPPGLQYVKRLGLSTSPKTMRIEF
jgi:hypothetical protein